VVTTGVADFLRDLFSPIRASIVTTISRGKFQIKIHESPPTEIKFWKSGVNLNAVDSSEWPNYKQFSMVNEIIYWHGILM